MTLNVNEIFYSIQGEGARAGCPSIFIRLGGCDLSCGFCDTEFESYKKMELIEIYKFIINFPCSDIVWTGGEPALQLTESIVEQFKKNGYYQCIETSGGHRVPKNIDFISVSPKVAEHVLAKNFPDGVTELRYVRHKGQMALPKPAIKAEYYFVSPIFDGDKPNYENINHCINLIKEDPKWRISLQLHKILKVL